jgi:prepilin-type N-terminal cleavage/methylation domain-containing protein
MNTHIHNPKSPKSKNKGFTLIELIVVVAVMSIIVAIAIPALSSSKTSAQQGSAEARAKVLNEGTDRAILKEVIPGVTTRSNWGDHWATNTGSFTGTNAAAEAAAAFLISNNLVRIQ